MAKKPTETVKRKAAKGLARKKAAQTKLGIVADDGQQDADAVAQSTGKLFETDRKVTARVRRLANRYKEDAVAKSQANAAYKASKLALIDGMKEDQVPRVRIDVDGNAKVLSIETKEDIHEEAAKVPKKKKKKAAKKKAKS